MNVETLIYAYLAICTGMIIFNCICIYVFGRQERALKRRSKYLEEQIIEQIKLIENGQSVSDKHVKFLRRNLTHIGNLMALDETLDYLLANEPDSTWKYIQEIRHVFTYLTMENHYRNSMQLAYFAYIIRKYHIVSGKNVSIVVDSMMKLIEEPSIYCRENALQVIYSTGDCALVVNALRTVDENERFHHTKLLTDGLLSFSGNQQNLIRMLWQSFDTFSVFMKVVILDFIRFSGCMMHDEILSILVDEKQDDEIRFSCIRYFGKYSCQQAYPILLSFLEHPSNHRWEYAAISAAALAAYPGERTIFVLKQALDSFNWYIRFNAAGSLEKFHLTYHELSDVMDSKDRYAREILQYRIDMQETKEERGEVLI